METKKVSKKSKVAERVDIPKKLIVNKNYNAKKKIVYGDGEDAVTLVVRKAIPYKERLELVIKIVESCFDDEQDTLQSYFPYAVEYWKRYYILDAYTNIKMPLDIDEAWVILKHSQVYSDVLEYAKEDIESLLCEVDDGIETKKDYLEHKSVFSKMLGGFSGAFEKISERLGDLNIDDILSWINKNNFKDGEEDLISSVTQQLGVNSNIEAN